MEISRELARLRVARSVWDRESKWADDGSQVVPSKRAAILEESQAFLALHGTAVPTFKLAVVLLFRAACPGGRKCG